MNEDVWGYPRPPRVEPCTRRVRVLAGGELVADSRRALRVLETSHPPGIYVPPEDVQMELLQPVAGKRTYCEYKGAAVYFDVNGCAAAAWAYPDPSPGFEAIAGHLSFYPSRVDECRLDEEVVRAQEGGFYGGWITGDLRGPFKGARGTLGW